MEEFFGAKQIFAMKEKVEGDEEIHASFRDRLPDWIPCQTIMSFVLGTRGITLLILWAT